MDPKLRILTIRLMESLRKNPACGAALGVEVRLKKARPKAA